MRIEISTFQRGLKRNIRCIQSVIMPFYKSIRESLLFFACVGLVVSYAEAQHWPLGHQPPLKPVAQYRPNTQPPQSQPLPVTNRSQSHPVRRPHLPQDSRDLAYPLYDSPVEPAPRLETLQIETLPQASQKSPQVLAQPITIDPSDGTILTNSNQRFGLDYAVYRDPNPYPIDPRKPCNECIRPHSLNEFCQCDWYGKNGRPYQDLEPGTCACSKASSKNKDNFSLNWPAPISALRGSHGQDCVDTCNQPRKHINDHFNHLTDFKLINYRRKDNGYSGRGSDPYGCLGESRVAGVGFRQFAEPVAAPFSTYPLHLR